MRVVVIGAGLAGLACARRLLDAGVDVVALEAGDAPGGRVRTDLVDGFRIDRGFQVLFTGYPSARRLLDFGRLGIRTFDPGARIAQGDRRQLIADPARDPNALWDSLTADVVPLADKLRVWRLSAEIGARPISALLSGPDQTTERFLRRRGFSERFLDNFARPFFGGIFLDRSLDSSAALFQYYWKLLAEGETGVPALGMGAISDQLAQPLVDAQRLRTGIRVDALLRDGERVTGVRLASGEAVAADRVIVATPAPEAARLTGAPLDAEPVGATSVYLGSPRPILPGRKLLLNANLQPVVNHAAPLSGIAPDLAPDGQHLMVACLLGVPHGDDTQVAEAAVADLQRMLTGDRGALQALDSARVVRVVRTPFAQFRQRPGFLSRRPRIDLSPGLVLSGEFTTGSSIDGALQSGESAAYHILDEI